MVKPLPVNDFRALRKVLEPNDFALCSNEINQKPIDLIDKKTWNDVTNLGDDVAIYTSSHYGSTIKELCDAKYLWLMLIDSNNVKQPCLSMTMLTSFEEFDASIFNLLHGYYRQAFAALRSALELTVMGAYLTITNQELLGEQWIAGMRELKLGEACDYLKSCAAFEELEIYLQQTINECLFKEKNQKENYQGGYVRQLFSKLSKYAHAQPGYTNGDLWQSNGPVFDHQSFKRVIESYYEVLIIGIVLIKRVKIKFKLGIDNKKLFSRMCASEIIKQKKILDEIIKFSFRNSN